MNDLWQLACWGLLFLPGAISPPWRDRSQEAGPVEDLSKLLMGVSLLRDPHSIGCSWCEQQIQIDWSHLNRKENRKAQEESLSFQLRGLWVGSTVTIASPHTGIPKRTFLAEKSGTVATSKLTGTQLCNTLAFQNCQGPESKETQNLNRKINPSMARSSEGRLGHYSFGLWIAS